MISDADFEDVLSQPTEQTPRRKASASKTRAGLYLWRWEDDGGLVAPRALKRDVTKAETETHDRSDKQPSRCST